VLATPKIIGLPLSWIWTWERVMIHNWSLPLLVLSSPTGNGIQFLAGFHQDVV
jgi:hypothetical protein